VENVKLKMTNDDLSRALDSTSQDQGHLTMLQEQAARLRQEKEMWVFVCVDNHSAVFPIR